MSESTAEPSVTVRAVMRTPAPLVDVSASVGEVARLMAEERVSGVGVLEDGVLVGIVTEEDLIERIAEPDFPTLVPFFDAVFVADAGTPFEEDLAKILATTAGELMTSPVFSLRDTATLSEVATFFVDRKFRQAPVVDAANAIVGIVSRGDLVPVIARLEAEP